MDAAGCGGAALPPESSRAPASSNTARPRNLRTTRGRATWVTAWGRPTWVIDGFMNNLLKTELDADTCVVDGAVEAVHATPRMIPVEACAPCAGETPRRGQAAEELGGGLAAGDCRSR